MKSYGNFRNNFFKINHLQELFQTNKNSAVKLAHLSDRKLFIIMLKNIPTQNIYFFYQKILRY